MGQSGIKADQQLATALKDAQRTSTELALSALYPNGTGQGAGMAADARIGAPLPAMQAIWDPPAADAGLDTINTPGSNGWADLGGTELLGWNGAAPPGTTGQDGNGSGNVPTTPPTTPLPLGATGSLTAPPGGAAGPQVADGAVNTQALLHDQRIQQAVSYFQGQGWSRQQAIGIVANLDAESSMDPDVHQRGGGPGYGLAQWENPRQRAFQQWAGHDIHHSTFEEQLQFVQYELTHSHLTARSALQRATTAADAASIVTRLYEGPKDKVGEAIRRAERARRIENQVGR